MALWTEYTDVELRFPNASNEFVSHDESIPFDEGLRVAYLVNPYMPAMFAAQLVDAFSERP